MIIEYQYWTEDIYFIIVTAADKNDIRENLRYYFLFLHKNIGCSNSLEL